MMLIVVEMTVLARTFRSNPVRKISSYFSCLATFNPILNLTFRCCLPIVFRSAHLFVDLTFVLHGHQ